MLSASFREGTITDTGSVTSADAGGSGDGNRTKSRTRIGRTNQGAARRSEVMSSETLWPAGSSRMSQLQRTVVDDTPKERRFARLRSPA